VRYLASALVLLAATTAAQATTQTADAAPQAAMSLSVPCSTTLLLLDMGLVSGSGGTVSLASGCVYTLTRSNNSTDGGTGLPVIRGNVTVQGNGATITRSTAAGTAAFRVFDVASGGTLRLSGLVLSHGLADDGANGGGAIDSHGTVNVSGVTFSANQAPAKTGTSGGAINSSGSLTVTGSTFSGNTAQEGGGIFSQKTATITDSTFTGNSATIYGGGGLLNAAGSATVTADSFSGNSGPGGGAIDNDATLKITDSTLSGNSAGNNGGGAVVNFGTTTVTQSTIADNSSPYGANVLNYTGFSLTLTMSILAGGQIGPNCGGEQPVTDGGYNIDTGSTCGFTASAHSMSDTQPELGPLASNGGPTQTMALPASSPAVNAIPAATPGCTGTTDQRGITRPQGSGCDIGAYELVLTTGTAPSTPTGLTVTGVTANSVSLKWNASSGPSGVTGYTVYRGGTEVGTTGGAQATTFTDLSAAPSTTYSYTVDAFDGSSHSPQSQPVSATTPAAAQIGQVQAGAIATPGKVTTTTITLSQPVGAGDLLVGWFGQYDASGQVKVSDNVNGAWTRASASTTFSSGSGDIALYYLQNSAAAPYGLTITITASGATYLEAAAGDYNGVATTGALEAAVAAHGNSTAPNSGSTAAVGAGELVVGGILTGGSPGSVTAGSSQGKAFTIRAQTASGSADIEDVLSSAAGAQDASATFGSATDWYAVAAVFRPA
jgi:hypothetical protein